MADAYIRLFQLAVGVIYGRIAAMRIRYRQRGAITVHYSPAQQRCFNLNQENVTLAPIPEQVEL